MNCCLPSGFLLCGVAYGLLAGTGRAAEQPPFPTALDRAAICTERLDRVLDDSLILGNGDINGLLFQSGGALVLRVTKNDICDARLDTSEDPPLLHVPIKAFCVRRY